MLHVGELAIALVRGAADLGVDFDVAHQESFLLRDRLEDQPALHALHGFGPELGADLPPVQLRLLDVDALRSEIARVVVERLPELVLDQSVGHVEVMRVDETLADLVPFRAQTFHLAMAADVGADRLAHLVDRVPTADALREFVADVRLLLYANL